jgi:hypothetical protein
MTPFHCCSNSWKRKPIVWSRHNFKAHPIRKKHIIASSAGLLIVIYSGWWWLTARAFEARIDQWIVAEQAKGAKIAPATVSVGGYPIAFSVKLSGLSLGWPSGFGFTAQSLNVRTHPWAPKSFKVDAAGGFILTLPPGDIRPPLTLAGETLRGHASFGDGPMPLTMDLSADTVSGSTRGTEGPASRELTVATVNLTGSRPQTPPAIDTDIAYDLSLKLIDLSAQALENHPLGATIKQITLHPQLLGSPPVTWDAAGIKAWRDAGGTVNLSELSLQWGQLSLSGNGTMALDADSQPEGAFTAHLSGFEQALDSLAAAGWIKLSAASIAKLALGIASHPGPDGKPTVDAPVTIQNRHITLGPAKLGQLPELKLD